MHGTLRVDSPLQGQSTPWHIRPFVVDSRHNATPKAGSTQPHSNAGPLKDSPGFRFVVVTDPKQLKAKGEMQKNRSFVMHDFLDKERSKPETEVKDPRARKRKAPQPATSINPRAPSDTSCGAQTTTMPDLVGVVSTSSYSIDRSRAVQSRKGPPPSLCSKRPPRVDAPVLTDGGLVAHPARHSRYPGRSPSYLGPVPFPLSRFGGKLNAFDTWPVLRDLSVNIDKLKYSCMLYFGSPGMVKYWVPLLLGAPHAFLSTMAVSAAHEDIMHRASLPRYMRGTQESLERISVRAEVTEMLNRILNTDSRLSNSTIAAVVHLLQAGIMGCDDRAMRTHQHGLHTIVQQRGGLARLAADTNFAPVLTIIMFTIGILHETRPYQDYVVWAKQQNNANATSPGPSKIVPESPVFCRSGGYVTLSKLLPVKGHMFGLLEVLRQFTDSFNANPEQSDLGSSAGTTMVSPARVEWLMTFWSLRDRVSSYVPGKKLHFASTSDQYIYEAVRLTAQIYVEALTNEVPFSRAAARLKTRAGSRGTGSSESSDSSEAHKPSLPVQIRDTIQHTDMTQCWQHLAGVLLWITLVAGASANPEILEDDCVPCVRHNEDEEARTYLAAITVRTNVLLSFDHPQVIAGTLESMLAIQECLGRHEAVEHMVYLEPEAAADVVGAYGLQEMP